MAEGIDELIAHIFRLQEELHQLKQHQADHSDAAVRRLHRHIAVLEVVNARLERDLATLRAGERFCMECDDEITDERRAAPHVGRVVTCGRDACSMAHRRRLVRRATRVYRARQRQSAGMDA